MKLYSLTLIFCTALLGISLLASQAQAGMFGYQEQENTDTSAFTKWRAVNQKHTADNAQGAVSTQLKKIVGAPAARFEAMLAQVNQRVNHRLKYAPDDVVWGQNDYWASPAETLARGTGDCDDFAIVKYYSLLALGTPAAEMRIVILNDQTQNVLHAVLAVEHGGKQYILDNRYESVYQDNTMHHYRPIYALNGSRWWRFS